MKHYFEDYLKHHLNEEAIELIDWLYNLIGEEALPDGNACVGSSAAIFETPPNQAQDIVIHMLTALNSIIWEGVKLEAKTKLNNLALEDFAQRQIDEFTPTVKLESGYFEMNNIIDIMIKELWDDKNIYYTLHEGSLADLILDVIDRWQQDYGSDDYE